MSRMAARPPSLLRKRMIAVSGPWEEFCYIVALSVSRQHNAIHRAILILIFSHNSSEVNAKVRNRTATPT
ncbi:protein of unknown function [Candidatus Methylomirabilis oxygeniifera]|uniref:Uncharacterized protein n=1 Tax=Methylomirabilis oxygeniifera TaxID=671143 RepID=D5MFS5_METO1|nr:protein of unknown function [Candidatus Methylomirabilis oxyfera]